jgi:hypothetical protein
VVLTFNKEKQDQDMALLQTLRLAGCGQGCALEVDFDVPRLAYRVLHRAGHLHAPTESAATVYLPDRIRFETFPNSPAQARLIAWLKAQHAAADAYYKEGA